MPAKSLQSCLTLRPYGLQAHRLLCPSDTPGRNTGEGCHFLLQRVFPTQGSNPSRDQYKRNIPLAQKMESLLDSVETSVTLGWGSMPAPLLALRPRLHDPGAEGAEKLVPETEPPLGLSCLPLGMKPQSPDGGLPSRAKASLVHPIDGGTCGGKAPKCPGGSTSPRGRVPTSSLLPKISPPWITEPPLDLSCLSPWDETAISRWWPDLRS